MLNKGIRRITPVRRQLDFDLENGGYVEVDYTYHPAIPDNGVDAMWEWHTVLMDGVDITRRVELNDTGIEQTIIEVIEKELDEI